MGIVDTLFIAAKRFAQQNLSWQWIIVLVVGVRLVSYLLFRKKSSRSPFTKESVRDRAPLVEDVAKRDAVLKQVSKNLFLL